MTTNQTPLRTMRLAFLSLLRKYFDLRPEMADESEVIEGIHAGIDFRGSNLWVLIFAIFVASLGLNVNSTAVIIGAMLISPLMGPIVGLGLAVGINDFSLLKRSAKSFLTATFISILTASVYFFFTPLSEVQSELLARTSPNIYDVFIAFFGGLAGIVALGTKGKGNVIPGVAIATALMPPLCTVGFGIGTGHLMYSLGALYLFFINTVFIALATFLGVRIMRFKKKSFVDKARQARVRQSIIAITVLTMVPAVFMTYNIVRESIFENNMHRFVQHEMQWTGTQIVSQKADFQHKTIQVVLLGRQVKDSAIARLNERLDKYNLGEVKLSVIQGGTNDSVLWHTLANSRQQHSSLMQDQNVQINALKMELAEQSKYRNMSAEVMPELRLLFPSVSTIALASVVQAHANDTVKPDTFTVAMVNLTRPFQAGEREKLRRWLKVRSKSDSLRIVMP